MNSKDHIALVKSHVTKEWRTAMQIYSDVQLWSHRHCIQALVAMAKDGVIERKVEYVGNSKHLQVGYYRQWQSSRPRLA